VGGKLFQANGRTDTTKLIIAFCKRGDALINLWCQFTNPYNSESRQTRAHLPKLKTSHTDKRSSIHKQARIIDDVPSASQFCWILRAIWSSLLVSVHPCTTTTKLLTHRAEIPARVSGMTWTRAGRYQIMSPLKMVVYIWTETCRGKFFRCF